MNWTTSAILFTVICELFFHNISSGLFVEEDLKVFACQDGWRGELPKVYTEYMEECFRDKTTTIECRKHCTAKKMSLFLDGKIWLYQLINVLKGLFPGQAGKDTVDKMIDIILECTDHHQKVNGQFIPYLCYRESAMWTCITKSAAQICRNNKKHRQNRENQLLRQSQTQGPGKKAG